MPVAITDDGWRDISAAKREAWKPLDLWVEHSQSGGRLCQFGSWRNDVGWVDFGGNRLDFEFEELGGGPIVTSKVTHWRPLPPPPEPAGAIEEGDAVHRLLGWADAYREGPKQYRFPSDPNAEFFPHDLERAAAEILRLRSAPPVSEDMITRAIKVFSEASDEIEGAEPRKALRFCWRAALTAALAPGDGA